MKFGRWEIGLIAGTFILACSYIEDESWMSGLSALGLIIISACFVSEVVKDSLTGKLYTSLSRGNYVQGFKLISRSLTPFSFYLHVFVYTLLAIWSFYYALVLIKVAIA